MPASNPITAERAEELLANHGAWIHDWRGWDGDDCRNIIALIDWLTAERERLSAKEAT